MTCKKCSIEFEAVHIDGEDYNVCKKCESMVLQKSQLNKILKESDDDLEMKSIKEYSDDQTNPVICPVCSTEMKRVNFLGFSGIKLDHCESCGAFLIDKGEISQMHELIQLVEDGKHTVAEVKVYNFLTKLSKLSYSIFSS